MNVFTLCIRLACDSPRHERLLRLRYWFTSNHIPFRFGCRPREASRLEAKTHEAEAGTHEAEAEAEATTHEAEAEAEAEARFFRPRGRGQASKPNIPAKLCYEFSNFININGALSRGEIDLPDGRIRIEIGWKMDLL